MWKNITYYSSKKEFMIRLASKGIYDQSGRYQGNTEGRMRKKIVFPPFQLDRGGSEEV